MRTSLKVISILILSFLLRDFFGTNSKAEFLRIYSCHSLLAPKSPLGIEEEEEGVFARISISELGQIQEIVEKDTQGLSEAGKQRLKKAWDRVSILYPGLDLRELIILEKEADLIETSSETKRISIGKNVLKTEALLRFTLEKGMFQLHIENELSKQRRDKDTWERARRDRARYIKEVADIASNDLSYEASVDALNMLYLLSIADARSIPFVYQGQLRSRYTTIFAKQLKAAYGDVLAELNQRNPQPQVPPQKDSTHLSEMAL